MQQMTQSYLEEVLEKSRPYTKEGRVASYIPELGEADPDTLGIALTECGGGSYEAGDHQQIFTLQSISKVLSLLLALEDQGKDQVFSIVGQEPTGDPFNTVEYLETEAKNKPFNPMVNSGAIAVASMIKGRDVDDRFGRILDFIRQVAGNPDLKLNEEVYQSEKRTGARNRSLAYFMESMGLIEPDVEDVLDLYFRFNSINVTVHDLANIGCVLANRGKIPGRQDWLIAEEHVETAVTIMFMAGMYNASGEFAIEIGFPSKSGVSGGIMSVVPGQMGISIIGPAIGPRGNSTAGVHILKTLSADRQLHLFRDRLL
ncbi:glutaminase A [Indiicoccus explosivorum]|uniref:glutaminase A n=1 Tax=Indiicoccus explosivorum TaxID=1917864 RepID=UPI0019D3E9DD|nr:glutaminase A [Indiicoccus explosivorum]